MTARPRPRRLLVAGLVAVLTTTACSIAEPAGGTGTREVPAVSAPVPTPPGARPLPRVPGTTTPDDSCIPEPSLRPGDAKPADRVPDIIRRGRLIIGIDQGSAPLSFRDPVTGELQGFDVDIAREIAVDIFGPLAPVDFRILSSDRRLRALEEGQVDFIVKSMSITCERQQDVRFSAPYFQARQRILALRGSGITSVASLERKRVCVAMGTTSLARISALAPRAEIIGVHNWADCLVALQQQQADAVTSDDVILAGLAAQDPYLEVVGPPLALENYGVGIARTRHGGDTDGLVRQVNATIERIMRDGTWRRLRDHWFGALGAGSPPPAPSYQE